MEAPYFWAETDIILSLKLRARLVNDCYSGFHLEKRKIKRNSALAFQQLMTGECSHYSWQIFLILLDCFDSLFVQELPSIKIFDLVRVEFRSTPNY